MRKDEGYHLRILPEHQLGLRKQILKFRNPLVGILLKPQFVSFINLLALLGMQSNERDLFFVYRDCSLA